MGVKLDTTKLKKDIEGHYDCFLNLGISLEKEDLLWQKSMFDLLFSYVEYLEESNKILKENIKNESK